MSSQDGTSVLGENRTRGGQAAPSKVLHIRNLPVDVTESDLRQYCAPYGPVAKCKLHVGPARNQGFIEFQDIDSAVGMVDHFAQLTDPPKLKGKVLYLQYSTRTEVTNASPPPLRPSNVLLVTFDNWKTETAPSIDFVHLMFSAFGEVMKVALFEKAGFYQALVQFPDSKGAREALEALNGHQLPRYMLPGGCNSCALRVEFSEHRDLVIKHQSDRFRDYTNPALPPYDPLPSNNIQGVSSNLEQAAVSTSDSSNVLHCMIDNVRYPVTVDSLFRVFSQCGAIQKIAIFEKNNNWQALIQFADPYAAASAKALLDGQCMFNDGLHSLRITFSLHKDLFIKANNERGWDFTQASLPSMDFHQAQVSSDPYRVSNMDFVQRSSKSSSQSTVTASDYEKAHDEVVKLVAAALQQSGMKAPNLGYGSIGSAGANSQRQPSSSGQPGLQSNIAQLLSGYSQGFQTPSPMTAYSTLSNSYGLQNPQAALPGLNGAPSIADTMFPNGSRTSMPGYNNGLSRLPNTMLPTGALGNGSSWLF